MVVIYRSFGTTIRSHFKGPFSKEPIGSPETSVSKYHYNRIQEGRHRGEPCSSNMIEFCTKIVTNLRFITLQKSVDLTETVSIIIIIY